MSSTTENNSKNNNENKAITETFSESDDSTIKSETETISNDESKEIGNIDPYKLATIVL